MDRDSLFQWMRQRLPNAQIARVELGEGELVIHTGRPGVVIGKGAATFEALRRELAPMVGDVEWSICEIRRIELEPLLVADALVTKLASGVDPEGAIVRTAQAVVRAGVRSVWVRVSGAMQLTHEEHGDAGPGELRTATSAGQVDAGAVEVEVQLLVSS